MKTGKGTTMRWEKTSMKIPTKFVEIYGTTVTKGIVYQGKEDLIIYKEDKVPRAEIDKLKETLKQNGYQELPRTRKT